MKNNLGCHAQCAVKSSLEFLFSYKNVKCCEIPFPLWYLNKNFTRLLLLLVDNFTGLNVAI
jgi:hypothetical protein